jgi:hypothetical protein
LTARGILALQRGDKTMTSNSDAHEMTTAQEDRPFVTEYTAEQKKWRDQFAANWPDQCTEISEAEWWDDMMFPPIKRMGFSNGPGASFHGERYDYRICAITGVTASTRLAHFAVQNAAGNSHYYRWNDYITLEEFKALCTVIIPNTGPCSLGWGWQL